MNTLSIYTSIEKSLPKEDWNRVVSSLKYDPIIWESIQCPQFIEKLGDSLTEISDWSPANLGLISIDFKSTAKDIQKITNPILDDNLAEKASSLLEGVKLERNLHNLEEAILIALYIREKLVLGNSWQSIRKEYLGNHLESLGSIFACLYGLINKPDDFLDEYLSIDLSPENYFLLLHTLLCNPLDTNQQLKILTRILTRRHRNKSLPSTEIYNFVHYLHIIHPDLAAKLSINLINHLNVDNKQENSSNHEVINTINKLEDRILIAHLHDLSNNEDNSNEHFVTALNSLVEIWIQLASKVQNKISNKASSQGSDERKRLFGNPFLEEFISQDYLQNHPLLKRKLLLDLLENKEYIESENFIKSHEDNFQSGFLNKFIYAINAFNQGDNNKSSILARDAFNKIVTNNQEFVNYLTNYSASIFFPFIMLLMDLDLLQEAITILQKAISYRRSDFTLYKLIGNAYCVYDNPMDAAEAFYSALLLKPGDINIRRQLANCLEKIGMWDVAYSERKFIFEEKKFKEIGPNITDIHNLTKCAIELGSLDEAIKLCEQAILLDDENGYTYSLIGKVFICNDDTETAYKNFERAIQLSPHTPETWLSLAKAHHNVENTERAIETLHTALQAIPKSAEIYLALGEMYLSQNALTEALNAFKHGAELDPSNTQIALNLGTTMRLLGHIDDAKSVLESAHNKRPNHVEVAYAYAKVLLQFGEQKKAIPLLNIVVKSNHNNIEPYLEFAEAALSSRTISEDQYSSEDILLAIQKAQDLDPDSPIVHALLGEILSLRHDYIAAKNAYQVALESNLVEEEKWFARLSLGMGRVALALGQEDIALASLQEALQVDPNNSYIHRALSEVYQTVNLPENSLQSARAALNLAINDVDTLTWYADHMLVLSKMDAAQHSQLSSNEFLNQIQSEALNALYQANQIAPTRADLLVKLGRIQSLLGEKDNALTTLNSLIDNDNADVNDLATAGELLSDLGDICGAISCLEKAYNKERNFSDPETSTLLINLASLYQMDADHESALKTLNQALENYPTFGPIYCAKANLLQEINNENDAIYCISEGLEKSSDIISKIQLHTLAGKVFRRKGELTLSLEHAQKGLSLYKNETNKSDQNYVTLVAITKLTADLFTSLLKSNRARLLLKEMERKFRIDITQDIDYCCSYVESFLNDIAEEELTSIISQMIEINPNHPRILAIQARIFNRRRDYHSSLHILHTALESANLNIWNAKDDNNLQQPIASLSTWYSLCESALELYQWDTALYTAQQALELAPAEPLAHLNLARTIVMRAEYQRMCEKTQVTTNSPGNIATGQEARALFEHAISDAIQSLKPMESDLIDEETVPEFNNLNLIINRWNARGMAIFGNQDEVEQAVSDLARLTNMSEGNIPQFYSDDLAALISTDIRRAIIDDNEKINKLTHMARGHIQDLNLYLRVALALSDTKPQKALNLLTNSSEPTQIKDNPLVAMSKALLARLLVMNNQYEDAKTAIDEALDILQNEPKWHNLAAEIYQNLCNIVEAIHHFDEAIRLEPHDMKNHLGLGKILIENTEFDPSYLKRATQVLERACRLEPENPNPWLYLSRAYMLMADIDQAASYADMAISLAPKDPDLYSLRGEISLRQDNPQEALDFANLALQIHKSETQAILIKSQALRDMGHINQALDVLEAAMNNMDDPLTLQIEYAILLNDVRGPKASITALEQLVEQYPDNPEILSLLAKNMAQTGQIEAAIKTAQIALQVRNGNQPLTGKADLHYLLGSLLIQTRQLDQAIHHLSESIALTPNFVDSYLELGRAQQEQRQYRRALEVYQKATRIAPNDPRPHYHAGIAYKEGKDYKASEAMLRRAADLAPDDVNIRRQLAAVVALNLVHNPRMKRIVEG